MSSAAEPEESEQHTITFLCIQIGLGLFVATTTAKIVAVLRTLPANRYKRF